MSNGTSAATVGPAIILSAIVAVVSILGTLLVQNMRTIEGKADKADAADRWTRTMELIHQECSRAQEELREKLNNEKLTAQDYKMQHLDCETRWKLHMEVCPCGKHKQEEKHR